ncbi:MAG: Fe-S cluster assembly protein SufD [Gammaproteobacteria bacterium]
MNSVAIKQNFPGDDAVAHYLAAFKRQRAALPLSGIPWMQRLRDQAASSFASQGFPTPRHEEWKYSDTKPLQKQRFELLAGGAGAAAKDTDAHRFEGLKAHRLVFVDGRFSVNLSSMRELSAGAVVMPLSQALPSHVDTVQSHLGHYATMDTNAFVALNTMLMSDGVFVHLPPGMIVEAPIHVLYLSTADGGTSQLRNLVVAERGAEATIIEHYAGPADSAYWTNTVTEIDLNGNAGIEHYKLEEEGDKAFHIATVEVHQHRDSRFTSHNAALGGRFVRNDINTRLDGENAQCALNGLYVIKGRQHVDNHTRIEHVTPRTVSRELYKGVMDGWSRGVFNGKVIVHKYAQLSDSEQANHSLLLSPNAEADPKPQLEIFADDVKCAHGVTVGQLDADALYYLRSRGVPKAEARGLLTFAFANDVLTRMRIEPLRAHLENLIRVRLPTRATELP